MCLLPAFDQGRQAHRGRHASPRREAVARACGLKGGTSPWVVDATAGLGRDAFILAGLGARVTLIERSPVVAALTRDALERARVEAATRETVERMELICAEATGYLEGLTGGAGPAAVYLDPMYPAAGRRANAKKALQLLQALLGPPEAPEPLLGAALQIAADRVVVKRPLKGEALAGRPPAYSIRGRSTRFDVYLTGGKPGQS
jgi:16S rRNA (guanine1516-N2)-methyltransferase